MNHHHKIFLSVILSVFALLFFYTQQAYAAPNSYFNMSESIFDNLTPFPKWTGVMGRYKDQQQISDDECGKVRYHPCEIKSWKMLVESFGEDW